MSRTALLFLVFLSSWTFAFVGGASPTQAVEVIAGVTENGPAASSGGSITVALYCEGSRLCGETTYTNVRTVADLVSGRIDLTADLRIRVDTSQIIVRSAQFHAHAVGGEVPPLNASSGNAPFAIFMRQHDPIVAVEASGVFFGATRLDCRGLAEFNGTRLVQSRDSAYFISR